MISTGTTEQALLAAVTYLFPNLTIAELSQALQVATTGGAERREEALADANVAHRASPVKIGRLDPPTLP